MPHDHEAEPSVSFYDLARYSFGNRWQFAVECEVQDCERDPWGSREPYGSFWLWVGGRVVGNTDEAEQLVHAFTPLSELARRSGDRPDARFAGMTNLQKLDLVIWARFGEDEEFDAEHWGTEDRERVRQEDLMKYEVVWRGYSPYTDGWEAILVEQDTTETLIWRRWQGKDAEVQEVSLPKGICGMVATLACQWFDPFRTQRMGSELCDQKGEIRLVTRSNDCK